MFILVFCCLFFIFIIILFFVADVDIPFKAHGPVKTSSPIEENMHRKPDDEGSSVFSVLFNCETEAAEGTDENPPNTQKPQCNGRVADK